MKTFKYLLTTVVAMSALTVHAGVKEGNGGDAVICNGGQDVYLLDYVEALGRNFTFTMPTPGETTREILVSNLARLGRLDRRSQTFGALANRMLSDIEAFEKTGQIYGEVTRFVTGQLVDIDDSNELVLPSGCHKEQMVVQRLPRFPEDRLLTIQSNLFFKMTPFQQAMTIVHELFLNEIQAEREKAIKLSRAKTAQYTFGMQDAYQRALNPEAAAFQEAIFKEAASLQETLDALSDSTIARYVNSLIFSNKFETLTRNQWELAISPLKPKPLPVAY